VSDYGAAIFSQHAALLEASAISPEVARERGYLSVDTKKRLETAGFAPFQRTIPGLLIPIRGTDGEIKAHQYRPDNPRADADGKKVKYETPKGSKLVLDVPPGALSDLGNPQVNLFITEGARKADSAVTAGLCCISVPGVWAWLSGGAALPDWRDVPLKDRAVYVCFDSDVMVKPAVGQALAELTGWLEHRGAHVQHVILPDDGDAKTGLDDFLAAGHGVPRLYELVRPPAAVQSELMASDAWDQPAPLGAQAALPGFPADAFPPWITAEVEAVAEFTQTPCDLGATVALGVLSAAVGGRAVVEVRGSWREPLNIFAVAAMQSGSRKSSVFAAITRPLLDTEQDMVEKAGPQIIEQETQRKVAQRDAEKAEAKASGLVAGEARDKALAEAISAAHLAEAITIPVMPRLVADDVTPEAAASLLAEQGGRLAVLSAEGGIFATLAGRYSSTPNLEVFLKGHAGDMLRVDRKGRPPEHVPSPALTLGLCVQPEVLRTIAGMPGFRGRGLLARILYSLPENLVGSRRIGTAAVAEDVQDTYGAKVRALVLTFAEWTDPAVLTLTPEAAELELAAERTLEPRLHPETGDLAGIVDWASKQVGATIRIAGLLHLASHLADGWQRPIGEDTMRDAIRIMDYYCHHALAAFDQMGVDPVLADARVLHRWIEVNRPERFTKREIFTGVSRARFLKVGDLDPPLDLLEQHGYIRREPTPVDRTGPGRPPSPGYLVHPNLAAETAESAQRPAEPRSADTAVSAAPNRERNA
jgi:replicative DNA helicase